MLSSLYVVVLSLYEVIFTLCAGAFVVIRGAFFVVVKNPRVRAFVFNTLYNKKTTTYNDELAAFDYSDMMSLLGDEPKKLEGTCGVKVCATQFTTRGIYNQGNIFDLSCIREYNLPEDEAIRIEQLRFH